MSGPNYFMSFYRANDANSAGPAMRETPGLAAGLGVAVLAVMGAWAAEAVLHPLLDGQFPFIPFFSAVFVVAWWCGLVPSLLATFLSVLVLACFILPPLRSIQIDQIEHRTGLMLFAAAGSAMGWLSETLHLAKREAQQALALAISTGERLRVTLASLADAVIVADEHGRIAMLNPVAERFTGWSRAAAVGKKIADVLLIVDEETGDSVADSCEQVLRTGKVVGLTSRKLLISKDGSERPIDDSAAPIVDEAGHTRGVVFVFRDVSAERTSDRAMRRNERELADFFESAALPLHATGPDGIIIRANQAELDMLGYERKEYIGRHISEFHVDPRAIENIFARLARGEVVHSYEARLRCKDGSFKDVLVTSSVQWKDEEFIQVRCFSRDITHRKQAEEALVFMARAGRELSALVDRESALEQAVRLPIPFLADWCVIYIVDEDGAIACHAFAHSDPAKQLKLAEMVATYPLDWTVEAASVRALRTGQPQLIERLSQEALAEVAQSDAHLALIQELDPRSVISVPLRIRDRIVGAIVLVASDPDRRYTERELGLAENFAERVATAVDNALLYHAVADVNQQKDEFLAMLAHELRNPLAAIRYTVALGKMSSGGPTMELLDIVDRQSQNLARLMDDLLDVSRISRDKVTLRMEQVDAAAIVRQASVAVRPIIEQRRHELVIELADVAMPIVADPTRAEQIVGNLLTNAAKYTPENGRICVSAHKKNGEAVIRISDNGIGLSPQMCARVFDLFAQADRTLDRSEGGLGIGLTVAQRLAEMHNGSVSVESAGLGHGSTFTLRLPLATKPIEQAATETDDVSDTAPAMRLMVVDDNFDTAASAAMLLRAYGHDVKTAPDGPAALELARSFNPQVILMDIGLPGMNGYEVAAELRQNGFAHAKIVAVSGYGQAEDRHRSQEAGFDHHFVKPVDYSALLALLQDPNSVSTSTDEQNG